MTRKTHVVAKSMRFNRVLILVNHRIVMAKNPSAFTNNMYGCYLNARKNL